MEKKRLLVDMDHVMANITAQFQKWYEEATGTFIDREKLMGKPEDLAFPEPGLIRKFVYTPCFFRSAEVMADSQEVLRELNDRYELYIVSAAMEFPQSLVEKHAWLQEHFPFIGWQQVILCGSKKPICGDIMIDDHFKNLENFSGTKLLYTATHNSHRNDHDFTRVNNWQEIRSLLLKQASMA